MLPVAHYYHCWADGHWQAPAAEHAAALRQVPGFRAGHVTVGLVGSPENTDKAMRWFTAELAFAGPVRFVTARDGHEQVTLSVLREYAASRQGEVAILYAHTKGAMNLTVHARDWRRAMTAAVVARWDISLALLHEYDAAGCFWLTPEQHARHGVESPFFAGNFWAARSSYLATLPEPSAEDRYRAERWIGLGNPRICDLRPGYPSEDALP